MPRFIDTTLIVTLVVAMGAVGVVTHYQGPAAAPTTNVVKSAVIVSGTWIDESGHRACLDIKISKVPGDAGWPSNNLITGQMFEISGKVYTFAAPTSLTGHVCDLVPGIMGFVAKDVGR